MSPRLGSWGCLRDLTGPQGDVGIPTQGVGDNHGLLLRVLLCGIHALFSSLGEWNQYNMCLCTYVYVLHKHTCTHILKGNLSHWLPMAFSGCCNNGHLHTKEVEDPVAAQLALWLTR